MADTVNKITIIDGPRHVIVKTSGISDGTGLSAQQIIDISTLSPAPTRLVVEEIWFAIQGYEAILVDTDRTADFSLVYCAGDGYFDFRDYGGVKDGGTGGTGDLQFTSIGTATANDTFDITINLRKKFS
jgi:hypothetical protein